MYNLSKVNRQSRIKRLTSTESGRNKLFQCSDIINDSLFKGVVSEEDQTSFKYHVNTCYQRYVRNAERTIDGKKNLEGENETDSKVIETTETSYRNSKRRKSDVTTNLTKQLCIVCDQPKSKGDSNLFRISSFKRAKQLLLASKFFKDNVYTRCVLFESPGDIFPSDVMYHNNCISAYILKFKRELELMSNENDDEFSSKSDILINDFIKNLQIVNNAYPLSLV